MKKTLLLLGLTSFVQINAQTTFFQEDWDGQGPGISAWTLHNVDNKTPVGPTGTNGETLSYLIQDAWSVITPAQIALASPNYSHPTNATGMGGNVIASNSWYTPPGASNDWLVSPEIAIPSDATNVKLSWAATSLGDTAYLEDYKVYISTTGNQVANFTTLLLNDLNLPNTGAYRTVDLIGYAGQNIRIAFRNDSLDQYVMFLDNIKIAGMTNLSTADIEKSKLKIYPNPTKGEINIVSDKEVKSTTVSDVFGRMISKGNSATMNISSFAKGTYIVQVEFTDGIIMTDKIIKE
jgi:hypothetical protein